MGADDGFDALEGLHGNMIEMGIIDPLWVASAPRRRMVRRWLRRQPRTRSAAEEQTPWRQRGRRTTLGCST